MRGDYTITSAPPGAARRLPCGRGLRDQLHPPGPVEGFLIRDDVGDYLGAGLPVVCIAGVGDLDALITDDIGALVSDHTSAQYRVVVDHSLVLIGRPSTRDRCRAVAHRELSLDDIGIPCYRRLYEEWRTGSDERLASGPERSSDRAEGDGQRPQGGILCPASAYDPASIRYGRA